MSARHLLGLLSSVHCREGIISNSALDTLLDDLYEVNRRNTEVIVFQYNNSDCLMSNLADLATSDEFNVENLAEYLSQFRAAGQLPYLVEFSIGGGMKKIGLLYRPSSMPSCYLCLVVILVKFKML